jgi:hypothetical protein
LAVVLLVVLAAGLGVALLPSRSDEPPAARRIKESMPLAEVEAILGKADYTGEVWLGQVDLETGHSLPGGWSKHVTKTWRGTEHDFIVWLKQDGTVDSCHYRDPTGTRRRSLWERLTAWLGR